jgi:hypothetical protein
MGTVSFFKKTSGLFALIGAVAAVTLGATARAQTADQPQMLITWAAQGSYVPPEYPDKALPNTTSKITASLELVSGGGVVNLSDQTIYWYENDTKIGGGQGVGSILFSPFGGAPSFVFLKAEIPSYNGNVLMHVVQIPIVQPKAVIETNHPESRFRTNPLNLRGTPYFFNVSDPSSLSYVWSVNGMSPTAAIDPQVLELSVSPGTPSGSTFAATLSVADPKMQMGATDSTNLTYAPQL